MAQIKSDVAHLDHKLDKALADSFPASDPAQVSEDTAERRDMAEEEEGE